MTEPAARGRGVRRSPLPAWARWALRAVVFVGLPLYIGASGCMERAFYHPKREATEPPSHLGAVEDAWFVSADGTRLHGWFVPAQGRPRREAPTILHVHGNAGNVESHVFFTEHLPPAGFNVFIFDYRGYGRSDGGAGRRGPLIADTHAALDHLLGRDDVDPDRIGMYAQSLGGAIGLNVAATRPEVRAVVVESAFASWRDIAACALGSAEPGPIRRFIASCLIRDGDRPDEAIAQVTAPILILHGTDDRVIPVAHGRRLAAAAPQARLVELSGGRHNTLRMSHPEVDALTIEFLEASLAGATP